MTSDFSTLSISGVDLHEGLASIGYSEASYLRFLRSFYESIDEYHDNFRVVADAENYSELRRVTHQLYGVVSMIGATSLTLICEEIMMTSEDLPWKKARHLLDKLHSELTVVKSGLSILEPLNGPDQDNN